MWMTDEGIEKIIASFTETSIRHKPVEINGELPNINHHLLNYMKQIKKV